MLEVMKIKTAGTIYDVKPEFLRLLCLRGTVKAQRVGQRWFVTREEMDRVFKGAVSPLVNCKPKTETIRGKLTLLAVRGAYGVELDRLRAMCKDGRLKAQRLGRKWYVDSAEAERVFGSTHHSPSS